MSQRAHWPTGLGNSTIKEALIMFVMSVELIVYITTCYKVDGHQPKMLLIGQFKFQSKVNYSTRLEV